jgi:hypothetical protein
MSVRICQLFASGTGFSNRPIDDPGDIYYIAAESIKQAYYLAYQGTLASDVDLPHVIVEIYAGDGGHRLWCGCQILGGIGVGHGDGLRLIRVAMRRHLEEEHPTSHPEIACAIEV